jgi:hypothetical protein
VPIADRPVTAPRRTAAILPAATAGASLPGSAATTPRQIAQAIPATQAEAIAEEAATEVVAVTAVAAVAEAINAARPADNERHFDLP